MQLQPLRKGLEFGRGPLPQKTLHLRQECRRGRLRHLAQPTERRIDIAFGGQHARVVELSPEVPRNRRCVVQAARDIHVTLHRPTVFVKAAQQVHRLRVVQVRGPSQPQESFVPVLWNSAAQCQQRRQVVHTPVQARLRRLAKPRRGQVRTLRDAPTLIQAAAHHVDRHHVATPCSPLEKVQRQRRVTGHDNAVQQQLGIHCLSFGDTAFCCGAHDLQRICIPLRHAAKTES